MPTIPIKQGVEVSPRAGGLSLIPQQRLLQGPSLADGIAAVASAFKQSVHDDSRTTQLRIKEEIVKAETDLTILQGEYSRQNNLGDPKDINEQMEPHFLARRQQLVEMFGPEWEADISLGLTTVRGNLAIQGAAADVAQSVAAELTSIDTMQQRRVQDAAAMPSMAIELAEAHVADIMSSNQPAADKQTLAIEAHRQILAAAYRTSYYNHLLGPDTPGEDYGDLQALRDVLPPGIAAVVEGQVREQLAPLIEQRQKAEASLIFDQLLANCGGDMRACLGEVEQINGAVVRSMVLEKFVNQHEDATALELYNKLQTAAGDIWWNEVAVTELIDAATSHNPALRDNVLALYKENINLTEGTRKLLLEHQLRKALQEGVDAAGGSLATATEAITASIEQTIDDPRVMPAWDDVVAEAITADKRLRAQQAAESDQAMSSSLAGGMSPDEFRQSNPQLWQQLPLANREAWQRRYVNLLHGQMYAPATHAATLATLSLWEPEQWAQLTEANLEMMAPRMSQEDYRWALERMRAGRAAIREEAGSGGPYSRASQQLGGMLNDLEIDPELRPALYMSMNVEVMRLMAGQAHPPPDFEDRVAKFAFKLITPVSTDPAGLLNARDAMLGSIVVVDQYGEFVPAGDYDTSELQTATVDYDWLADNQQLQVVLEYLRLAGEPEPPRSLIEQTAGALLLNQRDRLARLRALLPLDNPNINNPPPSIVPPEVGEEAGNTTVFRRSAGGL